MMKPNDYLDRQMQSGDRISWKRFKKLLTHEWERKVLARELTHTQYANNIKNVGEHIKIVKQQVRKVKGSTR